MCKFPSGPAVENVSPLQLGQVVYFDDLFFPTSARPSTMCFRLQVASLESWSLELSADPIHFSKLGCSTTERLRIPNTDRTAYGKLSTRSFRSHRFRHVKPSRLWSNRIVFLKIGLGGGGCNDPPFPTVKTIPDH